MDALDLQLQESGNNHYTHTAATYLYDYQYQDYYYTKPFLCNWDVQGIVDMGLKTRERGNWRLQYAN